MISNNLFTFVHHAKTKNNTFKIVNISLVIRNFVYQILRILKTVFRNWMLHLGDWVRKIATSSRPLWATGWEGPCIKNHGGGGKVAQWIKALAVKPGGLSLTSNPLGGQRAPTPSSCPLTFTHRHVKKCNLHLF